jgi:pre-rRNA-processing protein TSR3
VKVTFVYLREDDPTKSTMKKLERFGLAERIDARSIGRKVTLTPYGSSYIKRPDSTLVSMYGINIIDGSWARIEGISKMRLINNRRVPALLAANPVNYGKLEILSSVEALAAALFITGYAVLAHKLLEKFKWGPNFIVLNREPLSDYTECQTDQQVRNVESEYFPTKSEK